jgi:hypothetical protein
VLGLGLAAEIDRDTPVEHSSGWKCGSRGEPVPGCSDFEPEADRVGARLLL